MKKRYWLLAALGGVATLGAVAVAFRGPANAAEAVAMCQNKQSYAVVISGCSYLLESGLLNRKDVAGVSRIPCSAYVGMAEPKRAIEDCSRSIKLEPHEYSAHKWRALAYLDQGKHEAALPDLNVAVAGDPKDLLALLARGRAYHQMGAFQRAIDDFNAVLQIDPQNAGTLTQRGKANAALGRHAEAKADYEYARALNPEMYEVAMRQPRIIRE